MNELGDMGRTFPTVRGLLAERWQEMLIGASGLIVASVVAYAVHPLLVVVLACIVFAVFNEKLSWLQRRQERLEDFAVPPRLRRRK